MWGYRLVRDADFDDIRREFARSSEKIDLLHSSHAFALIETARIHANEVAALTAALSTAKEQAASRLALYESLTTRVNQLELENAAYRNKMTGLPAVAAQIQKGSPLLDSSIGVGADLFADVGDDEATRLAARGLLHSNGEGERLPSGADLTVGLGGD